MDIVSNVKNLILMALNLHIAIIRGFVSNFELLFFLIFWDISLILRILKI
jgi:hypothetical protein